MIDPRALAEMGEALGRAGVSVEGGGAFVVNGQGVAHFLFEDGVGARNALEAAGSTFWKYAASRHAIEPDLNQPNSKRSARKISSPMADAGVNIEALYSGH